ncbi:MAG: DUF6506 family protein [Burkholderiaceae bacterium]
MTSPTITWAYVYEHAGADPKADRHVLERGGVRSLMVPVSSPEDAPRIAQELVDEGVTLIELCGGFSLPAASRVMEAVGGKVAVGHVTFAVDAVERTAAYAKQFG